MPKDHVFLFDAATSIAQACLEKIPKSYTINAVGLRFPNTAQPATEHGELRLYAQSQTELILQEASQASHVLLLHDLFFRTPDLQSLWDYCRLLKRIYDACDDNITTRFVVLSSAAVYANEGFCADENANTCTRAPIAEALLDLERYLLNASQNRRLKPCILRAATPYGPDIPSIILTLYQQLTLIASLRKRLPRFYRGPRCPLIHIEDLSRAIVHLMQVAPQHQNAIFNIVDDENLRIGEIFALAAQSTEIPARDPFYVPHAAALPFLFKTLDQHGLLKLIEVIVKLFWERLQYAYALNPAPPVLPKDFLSACAWPRIDNAKLKASGFQLLHPSFRQSAKDCYRAFQARNWIPDLALEPCRRNALFTRIRFVQTWSGFLIDSCDPNRQHDFILTLYNDMPLWTTQIFSRVALQGQLEVDGKLYNATGLRKRIFNLQDLLGLHHSALSIEMDQKKLHFNAEGPKLFHFGPYSAFILQDDRGEIHFEGKIKLDTSWSALLKCLNSFCWAINA